MEEQRTGNCEAYTALHDIAPDGIDQISQNLGSDDGHCQPPSPEAALEPACTGNR
jgi:hypothetical protein